MRKLLLVLWLIVPAILIAWHYGPGQRELLLDDAAAAHRRAQAAAAAEDWATAASASGDALALLAKAEALTRQTADAAEHGSATGEPAPAASISPLVAELTVEQARARMRSGELLEGMAQLQDLLVQTGDNPALSATREQARHELASGNYHAAWLMRLEGAASDEWQISAEVARQEFRLLAETGSPAITSAAARNLEATIRLQRMDLDELKALPLPKNCKCNGKNLSQRCRNQRTGRKPSEKKSEQPDARESIKKEQKGAGVNSPGDGEAW